MGFALLALAFGGLMFGLPIIAIVRAGRAARLVKLSDERSQELNKRVHALEQQVLQLVRVVSRVETLEREVQQLRETAGPPATKPTKVPAQAELVGPTIEPAAVPPAPAAPIAFEAQKVPPPIQELSPSMSTVIPPAPTVIAFSQEGFTPLEQALRPAVAPPRAETPARMELPRPVEIPPPSPLPPPVVVPPAASPFGTSPRVEARTQAAVPPPARVIRPVPPQRVAVQPPGPTMRERMRKLLNLEEVMGTNYLGKLGVIILVIGVGGFVLYNFSSLPIWLQLLAGYLIGITMLLVGVRFERGRYRLLARAGIGGGWALIFFTTWALHHAGKSPIVSSETADLVLMLLVAAGMVVHTLRYNSQVVTGLAFLLPSLTVTVTLYFANDVMDAVRIPSLMASAILAMGLAVIVVRRRWYEMEVFGILSTFLNHFLWISPVIERHQGFPEYKASAALLIAYWAVFRVSYIVRKVTCTREEAVSTVAALLNTFLLMGVLKYQALHPELAFYFLLALGAAELTLGQLPTTRRRRAAFVILTTLGATFLVAAVPYKLSGVTLPVVLLAEAEAFFLAGVFTREIVFRRLGMLAGLLVAGDMNWLALAQVTDAKFAGLRDGDILKATVVFGTAALVFYANSHWVPRRWPDLVTTRVEDWSFRRFSYVAGSVTFLGLWLICPEVWTAVAWSAFAVALAVAGVRLKIKLLSSQAPIFAAAATLRIITVNFYAIGSFSHLSLRLTTVSLVATMLYLTSRWTRKAELAGAQIIAEAHSWAATVLLAVLIWHECPELWRAVAWGAMGLALALLGRRLKLRELSDQAHCLAGAAFVACSGFNLVNTEPHHHQTLRLVTVLLTAGLLYLCSRHIRLTRISAEVLISALHSWAASTLLAVLAWYELPREYAAPAWILLGLALAVAGRALKLKRFSFQSYPLAFASFCGALFINLIGTTVHTHIMLRLVTVLVVTALLFVCSRWARLVEFEGASQVAVMQTWWGTALAALLTWYELQPEIVAPVWCAMALALLVSGSRLKRRSLSAQGHLLAAAGLFSALTLNLSSATLGQFDLRLLVTVGACAASLCLCSPWSGTLDEGKTLRLPEAYIWAASSLLFLLIWYEVRPVGVAVGWALFGIILFELGFGRQSVSLRLQGYVALTASFVRSFYVNFNATTNHGQISLRVVTTVFLACVFFYVFGRLANHDDDFLSRDRSLNASPFFSYFGTITIAALLRAELDPNWVVAGWALMTLVLLAIAWRSGLRVFLHQGLLLSFAVLYRAALYNFYQSNNIPIASEHSRLLYVGIAVVLLFLCVPLALQLRVHAGTAPPRKGGTFVNFIASIGGRPEQIVFFVPFALLSMLLFLEMPNAVTLAWGVEAVAVFLFALWVGQRSFRLAGMGLLLVCVGKIMVFDFWKLEGSYRWLTAMGLGAALIVVSYLYTRYSDAIRRYL